MSSLIVIKVRTNMSLVSLKLIVRTILCATVQTYATYTYMYGLQKGCKQIRITNE